MSSVSFFFPHLYQENAIMLLLINSITTFDTVSVDIPNDFATNVTNAATRCAAIIFTLYGTVSGPLYYLSPNLIFANHNSKFNET